MNKVIVILRGLWRIPVFIVKYIISIVRTPIKDYPDDTWKGGGPEGPSSYNGGVPSV
jgi:hypothetical protein